ncbi:MAG: hypothetical protein ABI665_00190 [Vicinamibacterales bacterium]
MVRLLRILDTHWLQEKRGTDSKDLTERSQFSCAWIQTADFD